MILQIYGFIRNENEKWQVNTEIIVLQCFSSTNLVTKRLTINCISNKVISHIYFIATKCLYYHFIFNIILHYFIRKCPDVLNCNSISDWIKHMLNIFRICSCGHVGEEVHPKKIKKVNLFCFSYCIHLCVWGMSVNNFIIN